MTSVNSSQTDDRFLSNAMASFIQIGALLLLLMMCYKIIAPFISIVVWGVVISIGLYPAHQSLTAKLGGREKYSAMILVAIGLAIIIVPTWITAESSVKSLQQAATNIEAGTMDIPPPNETVKDWPLIGESVYGVWNRAADNLEATMNAYAPQLKQLGQALASAAGGVLIGALQFVVSVIIAGVLLDERQLWLSNDTAHCR